MTRQNENKIMKTYLEEIMNIRVFKFFQGDVITHSHVLISHSLLKPFPSKILILKKVHGNSFGRLRRDRFSRLRRSDSSRDRRVQVMNLDGRLLRSRRDSRTWLDDPKLGQPMFHLLITSTTRKISQVNCLEKNLSLVSVAG